MLTTTLAPLLLPLLMLFGNSSNQSAARLNPTNNAPNNTFARFKANSPPTQKDSGILEKMMVAQGKAALDIDLSRLNGGSSSPTTSLRFSVAPDSFFTVLVLNKALRGPYPGSMALLPRSSAMLPDELNASFNQLVVEKTDWTESFDIVIRDGKTGFTFFNIEGNLYEYDAKRQVLSIKDGRLLLSNEFAGKLGRPGDAGAEVGKISITTTMRTIEITHVVDGEVKSAELPPIPNGTLVPGPDVIVGELPAVQQFGSSGTQVGLAVATDSCNAGSEPLHWFAMPNNDHPVIPQNLYRMSGGAGNDERFEQIGGSWLKHAFTALQQNACGFGCQSSGTGTLLGAGCSDPYSASLNASQNSLGSRAWVNPFTGAYPRGDSPTNPRDHTGHSHTGTSHRLLVEISDLQAAANPGATYYAEAQYVTPHEFVWCQANPGQCNQYNNASYRRFNVSGTTSFSFSAVGSTVRTKPAIVAWSGATIAAIEPAPGTDGTGAIAFKVTNPSPGVWHYEYAVYNQSLDRAIQSFSVPLAPGVVISNIGFHAPPQAAAFANDGTVGSAGFSSLPWAVTQTSDSLIWNSETFAQNLNANAIRWGTLYNFRFDANAPPQTANATIGYFKTGSPSAVQIQGPAAGSPSPTPTPTPTPSPGNFSLSLNGSTSHVDVPSHSSLNIGSTFTVEAWVKTNSTSTQQGIVERYDWTPAAGGYGLRLTNTGKVAFFTVRNSSQLDYMESAASVTAGSWQHVAGVYDGSQLRIYINGVLAGSQATSFVPLNGNGSLKIGARGDDASFKFNGLIDEARVTASALYTSNFTPDPQPTAGAGTRGLWKFDAQDASDTSGNNNHGTLIGGAGFSSDVPPGAPPSPTPTPSPGNFSLSLNGSTSHVDVPSHPSLNIGSTITVEAWVKTNSTSTQQGIVERYDWTPAAGGYGLRLTNTGKVAFFTVRNSSQLDYMESAASVTAGSWQHVAGVYDGSQLRIYINGVLAGSQATSFVPLNGNGSLKIGARGDDASFKFNGLIDEARVTASALYTSNFTPDPQPTAGAGTSGLWKFDAQNANDSSSNNNHGTLIGGTTFSSDVPPGVPPSPTPTPSPGNFSLSLNGSTSYVDVPSNSSLNIGSAITVEAWVKTNSTSTQQGIVERYDWTPAAGGYGLRLTNAGKVAFFTIRNSSQMDYMESSSSVAAGSWQHVAGVYDGSQLRIYINGVLAGSQATSFVPLNGNGSLKIGARGDDASFKFNGLIDEARVTASALYTSNFTPDPQPTAGAGTSGLWKFDAQNANDSSSNNNHGTLIGGATFSSDVIAAVLAPSSTRFFATLRSSERFLDVRFALSGIQHQMAIRTQSPAWSKGAKCQVRVDPDG